MPHEEIHFIDVDHTITRRSSGRRFIAMGVRLGLFPVGSLLSLPFYYVWYRTVGMTDDFFFKREFPALRGRSKEYLENVSKRSFEEKLVRDIYPDALALIERLRSTRKRIVLATSSVDLIVGPLAEYLGIEEIIASSLEFVDGKCTGRFLESPIFSAEKKKKVMDFAREHGAAMGDCFFYSDSINDLPLLESIGNPVAVNPDLRLRRIALRRGWTILRFN